MSQAAAVRKPVVAIKVRPLPSVERGIYEFYHEDNKVVVNDDVYNGFDHVFGHKHMTKASDAEEKLHVSCVEPMLKRLFHGENCTILAYGQTGSGKTWTTKHLSQYLAVSLFERASQDHLKLKVKYVEVYMDKFKDLIFPENARVDIFETGGSTYNFTAKEVTVESPEQLQEILDNAEHVRKTSKTHMNTESSRSHACLMITIEQPWNGGGVRESGQFGLGVDLKPRLPPTPLRTPSYIKNMYNSPLQVQGSEGSHSEGSPRCVTQSTLFLVDLAGSERVGETGAVGEAAKEGASINNSLMNLRIIISDLRAGKRPPQGVYRRSKMTRLLQDSMGGNSNVLFIGCVTPSRFCDTDTKSTLQYAMKIAGITSTVAVNKRQVPPSNGEIIRNLQMEVASLKSQLEALEKQLEGSQQELAAKEEKIKKLETVILVQRTELEELKWKLQQEMEAGQQHVSEAEALRTGMQASISALETENQALQDQLSDSKAAVSALELEKQELQTKVQNMQHAEAAALAAGQEAKQQVARLEEEAEEGMRREVCLKQQLEQAQAEVKAITQQAEQQQRDAEQQAQLAGQREEEAARQQQGLQEQLREQQQAAEEQQQLHAEKTARLEEQLREQQQAAAAGQVERVREVQLLLEKAEEEAQQRVHAAEQKAQQQQEMDLDQLRKQHEEQQRQAQQREEQLLLEAEQRAQELQHTAEEQQRQHAADSSRLEEQLREQQQAAEEHAANMARLEEQLREQQQAAAAAQAAAAELKQQLCAAQEQVEASTRAAGDATSKLQAQLEASLAEQAALVNAHAAASASAAAELEAAKAAAQQLSESKEQQQAALEARLEEQGTALMQLQAVHASTQEQHERELADWAAHLQAVQIERTRAAEQAEERLQAVEGKLQSVQAERAQLQQALQAAAQDAGEVANSMRQQLDSTLEELQGTKQQLGARAQELDIAEQQLENRAQELEASKMELGAVRQQLESRAKELEASKTELDAVKQQLESRVQDLENSKTELGAVTQQMEAREQELKASNEELDAVKQQLESKVQDLENSKTELGAVTQQVEAREQELKASNEELSTVKQQMEAKEQELKASNEELSTVKQQLESSSAEGARLQQQLVSQQQEHAASANEQRAHLEAFQQEAQEKAQEVESLKGQLESFQQQHAAEQQQQETRLQAAHKDWGAVKQAALRVVQAAQEATSTMAARSATVVQTCHKSCAQRLSQELHALECGWRELQQAAPTQDTSLLHYLQWIQARHAALQQEAGDLRQQLLAQEVEIGALKGVVAAKPASDLDGPASDEQIWRSQVPAQKGHMQSSGMGGMGGKAQTDTSGGCQAGADVCAQPDQGEGAKQLDRLKAEVREQHEEEQGDVEQQQQQHIPDLGESSVATAMNEAGEESDGQQAVELAGDGPGRAWDEVDVTCSLAFGMAEDDDLDMQWHEETGASDREAVRQEGAEDESDGDADDVSPELDQLPSPTKWKSPEQGIPYQIDLSQIRLAIRSSIRSSDDYILLDREGNRQIVCKTWSRGGGKEAGIMHGQYIPVGEPGQIPTEKMEGVLGNLQGKWLHLPSHGVQGLPETLLIRASVYSHSSSRKRPQRSKAGTCDVAKACFAALEVAKGGNGAEPLELYGKPARHEFEKLEKPDVYRHQGSQLDVALAYPLPGCYSITRLNVDHLDPGSTVDLCVGDKQRIEVQPRALLQQALAQLQEGIAASAPLQATPPPGHVDRTWHAASVKSASVKSSAGDPVAFNFFSGLKPHMLMKRKASKKGASPTRQRTKA